MSNKKILIVSGEFFPINSPRSFRTTELVKELILQNHEVTVCLPDYPDRSDFFKEYQCKWINLGELKWKSIPVHTKNGIKIKLLNAFNRLLNLFFEYPNIELLFKINKYLKNENGYDLLISIAVPYPIHWGISFVWNMKKPIAKKWVADCGDPYMGDIMDTFRKPFYFKYLEKKFCRQCTNISIPFEGAIHGYYPEFHNKIIVIPQGFNFEEIKLRCQPYTINKIPTFSFAGTIFKGGRDPNPFLDFLNSLEMDFCFYIFTKQTALIEENVKKSKGRIKLMDFIPRNDLISFQSKMDFNLNFENSSQIQLPSKLIELKVIGRRILSINCADFSEEKIIDFLNRNYNQEFQVNNIEQFNIKSVVEKFLQE